MAIFIAVVLVAIIVGVVVWAKSNHDDLPISGGTSGIGGTGHGKEQPK